MDIKENLAENLIAFRKAANLTQAELAEKLNYSDKAVSKWERGESIPDLYALKNIADLYGIKIDTLIAKPKKDKSNLLMNISRRRIIICSCCAGLVWLVSIFLYAAINIIIPSMTEHSWLFLIYAVPITLIILLVLTAVWHNKLSNMIMVSLLTWTTIVSLYLSLIFLLPYPPHTLWMLFLIGIPAQALYIFWFLYRRFR